MLIACWSVKGGSGTTVIAASLALILSRNAPESVLLADLGGDVPAVLGVADVAGPGIAGWLAARDAPAAALGRLEAEVRPGLRMLPWNGDVRTRPDASGAERLASALSGRGTVVVDCGRADDDLGVAIAGLASLSLLVLRPCYLALRRAIAAPIRPSAVVLVQEDGRSLGRIDIEEVLGVPVRAEIRWDAAIARTVDAGLLAARLPRSLERALRIAA